MKQDTTKKKRADKKITKVSIEPGCTSCGMCALIAPQVFKMEKNCKVKENVDPGPHTEAIKKAAQSCPEWVISFKEQEESKRGSEHHEEESQDSSYDIQPAKRRG